MKYILAYDLGTGGTKTSLFDQTCHSVASSFYSCDTSFPKSGWHEQCPEDWWTSVVLSTQKVLSQAKVSRHDIVALAVSGHSLGIVPIGSDGHLLSQSVPIWSDARAGAQANSFFGKIKEEEWYVTTGNGFPPPLYSVFKIMWYRDHFPNLYEATHVFLGTKDYINYRMTGILCTDRSYASGSGIYSLSEERYLSRYAEAAGIDLQKFPVVLPSTEIIGTVLPEIAELLGISEKTMVCAGGVDNACMALGAACTKNGEAYTSLGTSSWIAVSGNAPILDTEKRPYVFAHAIPGQYVSATCIFSAGNSYRWARNVLCQDLVEAESYGGTDSYLNMDLLAQKSPAGSNGLLFNPSLAGGSSLDDNPHIRGCFTGLELRHTRSDLLRAVLEGVCMNLRLALDVLTQYADIKEDMLLVGGGGKSLFWRSLFANIFEKDIIETNIGQDAGSLGVAVIAAIGAGLWDDFEAVKEVHTQKSIFLPDSKEVSIYRALLPLFAETASFQSKIGEALHRFEQHFSS